MALIHEFIRRTFSWPFVDPTKVSAKSVPSDGREKVSPMQLLKAKYRNQNINDHLYSVVMLCHDPLAIPHLVVLLELRARRVDPEGD